MTSAVFSYVHQVKNFMPSQFPDDMNFIAARLVSIGIHFKDAIDVNTDGYVYAHLANFKRLADRVFSDDLDGIMIDSANEKKFLERKVIIENYDFVKENRNDKRLKSGHNVIFQI